MFSRLVQNQTPRSRFIVLVPRDTSVVETKVALDVGAAGVLEPAAGGGSHICAVLAGHARVPARADDCLRATVKGCDAPALPSEAAVQFM